jgi:ABC-type sugar transport system ATPase subunit
MFNTKMSPKTKKILNMSNVKKSFSGVTVLKDVNFNLRPSEVHILAGENGAGKSTLMKILGGIHRDYSGKIEISGEETQIKSVEDASSKGISIIHQELSLTGSLNALDNIFLGRELSKFGWLKKNRMKKYAQDTLSKFDIKIDFNKPVDHFPISIQQMIEIAKALAFNCEIIVMDEPTSALTDPEVKKLFKLIGQLKKQGCGIVYISHKMEEIYEIADRITVLRDGKYIGTEYAEKLPSAKLIKWMVGRELNQQFPRHTPKIGKTCLKVNNFSIKESESVSVKNVSLNLREGEIVGIAGLQGSGNSELLNGIFGVYGKPNNGNIKVNGLQYIPTKPRQMIKKGVALLTNDRKSTGLVIQMDIIKNGTLAALEKFSPFCWLMPHQEKLKLSKTTKSLNLKANSLYQKVSSLSGGNQQKVVISKWIETKPKILLLDEPTKGVDIAAKHDIYELMNKWTSEGIAIILITSEMPELLAMSDRILVMHRGSITAEFTNDNATQENILSAALGEKINAEESN